MRSAVDSLEPKLSKPPEGQALHLRPDSYTYDSTRLYLDDLEDPCYVLITV